MRHATAALTLLWAIALGYVFGALHYSGDYARGFAAGYETPHPQTLQERVTGSLLCGYARLACHAPAH